MDNKRLNLRIVATIAACLAVIMFASCKKDTPDLNGTVTITPNVEVVPETELTATYSGSETVTWQWKKGGEAIDGATKAKYTPTVAGMYTATASAKGYKDVTSAAVDVQVRDLKGAITISPNANVFTGDVLTAAYGGSETATITWQWNKSGTAISGATSNKYTPTEAGSYTVTASAKGYNSKTSAAVEVKTVSAILLEELQYNNLRYVYEYDNQNRITKYTPLDGNGQPKFIETFNYNGDLVEIVGSNNQKITFTKNGNIITLVYSYNEYVRTIELNAQGLPIKDTWKLDNEDQWSNTFTWQNGNLIKQEGDNWSATYTYDVYKSPFYHCKTPKWVLFFLGNNIGFYNENNIETAIWEGEEAGTETYIYTYNADGFPATMTRSDGYTETYKYKKK